MSFMSFVASDYGPGDLEDELYSDEDFGYGGNSRHKEDLCFDERPYASDEFLNLNIQEQKAAVASLFREKYPSEELQEAPINAVVGLLKHDDTFLLSGASFAQSRVPELFFHMIEKKHKPVVLVLNSIDTVGDQMVLEKQAVGITAVNLTWRTMNKDTLKKLKDNQYSFIYISPDVFLNNEDFAGLYDSNKFSRHLVLKVVNEAYWIYLWNLKKTEQSKNFSVHVTPEDVEKFRTTYRYNLAKSLNEISTVPLLLMSESCRPQAVSSIIESLNILPKNINMILGEIVRPELRYIRVDMSKTLNNAEDLFSIIPPESSVSNDDFPRMVIYSGTIDLTLNVMYAVCKARGNPKDINNGNSACIRRYHSVTGEKDKAQRAKEYGEGKFPILSCSPALELGQNWKRVKVVVIMGAMDPAISYQLAGKAGRDGHSSLVIHFVQPKMPKSPNNAREIVTTSMTNQDRMHAFRLTSCCLRVVYAVDTLKGYIPMTLTDPGYLAEIERERSAGMPVCRCSNCDPKGAALLLRLLPYTNAADLESLMSSNFTKPQDNPLASQEEQENEESEDEESEESEDEESEDEESEDEESEDERSDNDKSDDESPKDKKRAARQNELGCIPLNFDYRDGLSFGNRL